MIDRHGTPPIHRSMSRPCPSVHARTTVASLIRLHFFITRVADPLRVPYPTSHPPPHPSEPRFNTISTTHSGRLLPTSLPPAHPPHTKSTTIPLKLIALTGTQPSKGSLPSLDTTQGPDTITTGFASLRFISVPTSGSAAVLRFEWLKQALEVG
jgi:hypothetical protein